MVFFSFKEIYTRCTLMKQYNKGTETSNKGRFHVMIRVYDLQPC